MFGPATEGSLAKGIGLPFATLDRYVISFEQPEVLQNNSARF